MIRWTLCLDLAFLAGLAIILAAAFRWNPLYAALIAGLALCIGSALLAAHLSQPPRRRP